MNEKSLVSQGIQGSFAGIASAFITQTLEHMIPWMMVSAAVIVCDLAFGVRKSLLMGEEVRFSRAVRNTMGKMVTYFAFVCMVCMICVASGEQYDIDIWSCLLVCFIEGCSIIGNILKPKGINFNLIGAFGAMFKRVGLDKEDAKEVFKEVSEEELEKKRRQNERRRELRRKKKEEEKRKKEEEKTTKEEEDLEKGSGTARKGRKKSVPQPDKGN